MSTPTRYSGKIRTALKKATSFVTMTGFFAAAAFLVAILWLPTNDALASTAVDVQPSMLLALDRPERPAGKLRLPDLSSLTDEEMDALASLPPPDLVMELNTWTYTSFYTIVQSFSIASQDPAFANYVHNTAEYVAKNYIYPAYAKMWVQFINDWLTALHYIGFAIGQIPGVGLGGVIPEGEGYLQNVLSRYL